jgi:hypothetical protein
VKIENVHGRYFIRTFWSGPEVSVRAFTAGKSVAFAEGKSMDAALAAIGNLLDDRDGRERAARQDGIPTAQEFAEAFAAHLPAANYDRTAISPRRSGRSRP